MKKTVNVKTRILSVILAAIMFAGMLPISTVADDAPPPAQESVVAEPVTAEQGEPASSGEGGGENEAPSPAGEPESEPALPNEGAEQPDGEESGRQDPPQPDDENGPALPSPETDVDTEQDPQESEQPGDGDNDPDDGDPIGGDIVTPDTNDNIPSDSGDGTPPSTDVDETPDEPVDENDNENPDNDNDNDSDDDDVKTPDTDIDEDADGNADEPPPTTTTNSLNNENLGKMVLRGALAPPTFDAERNKADYYISGTTSAGDGLRIWVYSPDGTTLLAVFTTSGQDTDPGLVLLYDFREPSASWLNGTDPKADNYNPMYTVKITGLHHSMVLVDGYPGQEVMDGYAKWVAPSEANGYAYTGTMFGNAFSGLKTAMYSESAKLSAEPEAENVYQVNIVPTYYVARGSSFDDVLTGVTTKIYVVPKDVSLPETVTLAWIEGNAIADTVMSGDSYRASDKYLHYMVIETPVGGARYIMQGASQSDTNTGTIGAKLLAVGKQEGTSSPAGIPENDYDYYILGVEVSKDIFGTNFMGSIQFKFDQADVKITINKTYASPLSGTTYVTVVAFDYATQLPVNTGVQWVTLTGNASASWWKPQYDTTPSGEESVGSGRADYYFVAYEYTKNDLSPDNPQWYRIQTATFDAIMGTPENIYTGLKGSGPIPVDGYGSTWYALGDDPGARILYQGQPIVPTGAAAYNINLHNVPRVNDSISIESAFASLAGATGVERYAYDWTAEKEVTATYRANAQGGKDEATKRTDKAVELAARGDSFFADYEVKYKRSEYAQTPVWELKLNDINLTINFTPDIVDDENSKLEGVVTLYDISGVQTAVGTRSVDVRLHNNNEVIDVNYNKWGAKQYSFNSSFLISGWNYDKATNTGHTKYLAVFSGKFVYEGKNYPFSASYPITLVTEGVGKNITLESDYTTSYHAFMVDFSDALQDAGRYYSFDGFVGNVFSTTNLLSTQKILTPQTGDSGFNVGTGLFYNVTGTEVAQIPSEITVAFTAKYTDKNAQDNSPLGATETKYDIKNTATAYVSGYGSDALVSRGAAYPASDSFQVTIPSYGYVSVRKQGRSSSKQGYTDESVTFYLTQRPSGEQSPWISNNGKKGDNETETNKAEEIKENQSYVAPTAYIGKVTSLIGAATTVKNISNTVLRFMQSPTNGAYAFGDYRLYVVSPHNKPPHDANNDADSRWIWDPDAQFDEMTAGLWYKDIVINQTGNTYFLALDYPEYMISVTKEWPEGVPGDTQSAWTEFYGYYDGSSIFSAGGYLNGSNVTLTTVRYLGGGVVTIYERSSARTKPVFNIKYTYNGKEISQSRYEEIKDAQERGICNYGGELGIDWYTTFEIDETIDIEEDWYYDVVLEVTITNEPYTGIGVKKEFPENQSPFASGDEFTFYIYTDEEYAKITNGKSSDDEKWAALTASTNISRAAKTASLKNGEYWMNSGEEWGEGAGGTTGRGTDNYIIQWPEGDYYVVEATPPLAHGVKVYETNKEVKKVTISYGSDDEAKNASRAIFTNELRGDTGSIRFVKSVAGAYVTEAFEFDVVDESTESIIGVEGVQITFDPSTNGSEVKEGKIYVKSGTTVTISGLALGKMYTVTETNNPANTTNFTTTVIAGTYGTVGYVSSYPTPVAQLYANDSPQTLTDRGENPSFAPIAYFTNTRRVAGSLTVKKIVDTPEFEPNDAIFVLTVAGNFVMAESTVDQVKTTTVEQKTYSIYFTKAFVEEDDRGAILNKIELTGDVLYGGAWGGAGYTFPGSGGIAAITYPATIYGEKYTVTETAAYYCDGDSPTNDVKPDFIVPSAKEQTIGASAVTVSFTNRRKAAEDVTITKSLASFADSNHDNVVFKVQLTSTNNASSYYAKFSYNDNTSKYDYMTMVTSAEDEATFITVKKGQIVTIAGLPNGFDFKVVETAKTGYTAKYATGDNAPADWSDVSNAAGAEFTAGETMSKVYIHNTPDTVPLYVRKIAKDAGNDKFSISVDGAFTSGASTLTKTFSVSKTSGSTDYSFAASEGMVPEQYDTEESSESTWKIANAVYGNTYKLAEKAVDNSGDITTYAVTVDLNDGTISLSSENNGVGTDGRPTSADGVKDVPIKAGSADNKITVKNTRAVAELKFAKVIEGLVTAEEVFVLKVSGDFVGTDGVLASGTRWLYFYNAADYTGDAAFTYDAAVSGIYSNTSNAVGPASDVDWYGAPWLSGAVNWNTTAIIVPGALQGKEYTVSECIVRKSGETWTEITSNDVYTVIATQANTALNGDSGYKFTAAANGAANNQITLTNTRRPVTVDLSITKTMPEYAVGATTHDAKEFTVRLKLISAYHENQYAKLTKSGSEGSYSYAYNGVAAKSDTATGIKIKRNETVKVTGLPADVEFEIVEDDATGYTPRYAVVSDDNSETTWSDVSNKNSVSVKMNDAAQYARVHNLPDETEIYVRKIAEGADSDKFKIEVSGTFKGASGLGKDEVAKNKIFAAAAADDKFAFAGTNMSSLPSYNPAANDSTVWKIEHAVYGNAYTIKETAETGTDFTTYYVGILNGSAALSLSPGSLTSVKLTEENEETGVSAAITAALQGTEPGNNLITVTNKRDVAELSVAKTVSGTVRENDQDVFVVTVTGNFIESGTLKENRAKYIYYYTGESEPDSEAISAINTALNITAESAQLISPVKWTAGATVNWGDAAAKIPGAIPGRTYTVTEIVVRKIEDTWTNITDSDIFTVEFVNGGNTELGGTDNNELIFTNAGYTSKIQVKNTGRNTELKFAKVAQGLIITKDVFIVEVTGKFVEDGGKISDSTARYLYFYNPEDYPGGGGDAFGDTVIGAIKTNASVGADTSTDVYAFAPRAMSESAVIWTVNNTNAITLPGALANESYTVKEYVVRYSTNAWARTDDTYDTPAVVKGPALGSDAVKYDNAMSLGLSEDSGQTAATITAAATSTIPNKNGSGTSPSNRVLVTNTAVGKDEIHVNKLLENGLQERTPPRAFKIYVETEKSQGNPVYLLFEVEETGSDTDEGYPEHIKYQVVGISEDRISAVDEDGDPRSVFTDIDFNTKTEVILTHLPDLKYVVTEVYDLDGGYDKPYYKTSDTAIDNTTSIDWANMQAQYDSESQTNQLVNTVDLENSGEAQSKYLYVKNDVDHSKADGLLWVTKLKTSDLLPDEIVRISVAGTFQNQDEGKWVEDNVTKYFYFTKTGAKKEAENVGTASAPAELDVELPVKGVVLGNKYDIKEEIVKVKAAVTEDPSSDNDYETYTEHDRDKYYERRYAIYQVIFGGAVAEATAEAKSGYLYGGDITSGSDPNRENTVLTLEVDIPETAEFDDNSDPVTALAATHVSLGNKIRTHDLTVKKVVDSVYVSTDDAFEFYLYGPTEYMKLWPSGQNVPDLHETITIAGEGKDGSHNYTVETVDEDNSKIKFTLKATGGDSSVIINGLTDGIDYAIEEIKPYSAKNIKIYDSSETQITLTDRKNEAVTPEPDLDSGTHDTSAIIGYDVGTVTFTNKRLTDGVLNITKTLTTGSHDDFAVELEDDKPNGFPFTITQADYSKQKGTNSVLDAKIIAFFSANGGGGDYYDSHETNAEKQDEWVSVTFRVPAGETLEIKDLEVGVPYTITELIHHHYTTTANTTIDGKTPLEYDEDYDYAADGATDAGYNRSVTTYPVSASMSTGTNDNESKGNTSVTFTNTRKRDGGLKITKSVAAEETRPFIFRLYADKADQFSDVQYLVYSNSSSAPDESSSGFTAITEIATGPNGVKGAATADNNDKSPGYNKSYVEFQLQAGYTIWFKNLLVSDGQKYYAAEIGNKLNISTIADAGMEDAAYELANVYVNNDDNQGTTPSDEISYELLHDDNLTGQGVPIKDLYEVPVYRSFTYGEIYDGGHVAFRNKRGTNYTFRVYKQFDFTTYYASGDTFTFVLRGPLNELSASFKVQKYKYKNLYNPSEGADAVGNLEHPTPGIALNDRDHTKDTYTFTLAPGEYMVFEGLYSGSSYVVTETNSSATANSVDSYHLEGYYRERDVKNDQGGSDVVRQPAEGLTPPGVDNGEYDSAGATGGALTSLNERIYFVNARDKARLTLEKEIVGAAAAGAWFKVTVSGNFLNNSATPAVTTSEKTVTVYFTADKTAKDLLPEETPPQGAIFAQWYKNGAAHNGADFIAEIPNVVAGEVYIVTETGADGNSNGQFALTAVPANSSVTNVTVNTDTVEETGEPAGYKVTVTGDNSNVGALNAVTLTNTRAAEESLTVSKKVIGTVLPDDKFEFTITSDDFPSAYQAPTGATLSGAGAYTFELKHGESITFDKLFAGVVYSIQETALSSESAYEQKGYNYDSGTTYVTGAAKMDPIEHNTVTFYNNRKPDASATVTKAFKANSTYDGEAFKFTLTKTTGQDEPKLLRAPITVQIGSGEPTRYDSSAATIEFSLKVGETATITGLERGIGYKVSESFVSEADYTYIENYELDSITDGTSYANGNTPNTTFAASATPVAMTFTNARQTTGVIKLVKIVADDSQNVYEAGESFLFRLKVQQPPAPTGDGASWDNVTLTAEQLAGDGATLVVNGDDEEEKTDAIADGTYISVNRKESTEVTVSGLELGRNYRFEEAYIISPAYGVLPYENNGLYTALNSSLTTEQSITEPVRSAVVPGVPAQVVNSRQKQGELILEKLVDGMIDKGEYFVFTFGEDLFLNLNSSTVQLWRPDGEGWGVYDVASILLRSTKQVALHHGERVKITGLVSGRVYTVVESKDFTDSTQEQFKTKAYSTTYAVAYDEGRALASSVPLTGSGATATARASVGNAGDAATELTFTNEQLLGKIIIGKRADDPTPDDTEFTFQVTGTFAEEVTKVKQIKTQDPETTNGFIDLEKTAEGATAWTQDTEYSLQSGKLTFALKKNEQIEISGLSTGADYTVTETTVYGAGVPSATDNEYKYLKYDGALQSFLDYSSGRTYGYAPEQTGIVIAVMTIEPTNPEYELDFYSHVLQDVYVTKRVVGDVSNEPYATQKDATFRFYVLADKESDDLTYYAQFTAVGEKEYAFKELTQLYAGETPGQAHQISLKDGDTVKLTGLDGMEIKLVEVPESHNSAFRPRVYKGTANITDIFYTVGTTGNELTLANEVETLLTINQAAWGYSYRALNGGDTLTAEVTVGGRKAEFRKLEDGEKLDQTENSPDEYILTGLQPIVGPVMLMSRRMVLAGTTTFTLELDSRVAEEYYNYSENDPNAPTSSGTVGTPSAVIPIETDTVILRGLPYGANIEVTHGVTATAQTAGKNDKVPYTRAGYSHTTSNGVAQLADGKSTSAFTFSNAKSSHAVTFIERYNEQKPADPPSGPVVDPDPPPRPSEEPPAVVTEPPVIEPTEPPESPTTPDQPTETPVTTPPAVVVTPDEPSLPSPAPGNTLVPDGEGGYIEYDDENSPTGAWHQDPDTGEWIFDEFPPLGGLTPPTGDAGLLGWGVAAAGAVTAIAFIVKPRRRRKK